MIRLIAIAFALLPPYYMDCVVAIGINVPVVVNGTPVMENGAPKLQWEPIASGFLYGAPTGEKNDKGKLYRVYLVSNRHVIKGQTELILRFNPKESKPAKEYSLPLTDAKQSRRGSHRQILNPMWPSFKSTWMF